MFLTLPLMAAIQIISACIGWQTRSGLARNIGLRLPAPALYALVTLLVIANTINIAADLAAMGEALRLVIGGPALLYALAFGVACLVAEILVPYHRYAGYLKFLTLVLFVYVAAAFTVEVPWSKVLASTFPQALVRARLPAHDRRRLRHYHQPVSILLAGLSGGRGIAAEPQPEISFAAPAER